MSLNLVWLLYLSLRLCFLLPSQFLCLSLKNFSRDLCVQFMDVNLHLFGLLLDLGFDILLNDNLILLQVVQRLLDSLSVYLILRQRLNNLLFFLALVITIHQFFQIPALFRVEKIYLLLANLFGFFSVGVASLNL